MARVWQEGYIASDDAILRGQPIIAGTRTPVRAIAEMRRMGVPPEEIQTQLPHLTLAQMFAALSYFCDHQAEILAAIERNRLAGGVPGAVVHPPRFSSIA